MRPIPTGRQPCPVCRYPRYILRLQGRTLPVAAPARTSRRRRDAARVAARASAAGALTAGRTRAILSRLRAGAVPARRATPIPRIPDPSMTRPLPIAACLALASLSFAGAAQDTPAATTMPAAQAAAPAGDAQLFRIQRRRQAPDCLEHFGSILFPKLSVTRVAIDLVIQEAER